MKMSNDKKKELLLKNFDIIKGDCEENEESLGSAVKKMFKLDKQTAVDMWEYLLSTYEGFIKSDDSYYVTADIVNSMSDELGENQIGDIIINSRVLKNALFAQSYRVWAQVDIVTHYIAIGNLQIADELLGLLYSNPYKEDGWYEVMDRVMPSSDADITNEAYELLEMWCDKVKNDKERAKLSIKMMEFVD